MREKNEERNKRILMEREEDREETMQAAARERG